MIIGIIGLGVVGKAVKYGLEKKEGHTIHVFDIQLPETSLDDVYKHAELIFICVSTPRGKNGECDISDIIDVCTKLNLLAKKSRKKKDVVIKSTTDVSRIEEIEKQFPYLRIAINPEFLKEQAAIHDFCHQDICVIGTKHKDLYKKIVKAHGKLADEYIHTTPVNASLVKYFCNAFNATRVIFANLFYDLALKVGADYTEVKSIAVKRNNMIDHYLDCNVNLRGFSGACLPKDTEAMLSLCKKLELEYDILNAILKDNVKLHAKHPEK